MELYPKPTHDITITYSVRPGSPALPKRLWKHNRWEKNRRRKAGASLRGLIQRARAAMPGNRFYIGSVLYDA